MTLKVGSPTASYYSANFCGHRHCWSSDIKFCICHVTTWLKGHVTWWILSPTLGHHPLYGRCNISNPNVNFNFNVYKLPTFSLSHLHLSPGPFVNPCKTKARFQFPSSHFIDHIFNDYLVKQKWLFRWMKIIISLNI